MEAVGVASGLSPCISPPPLHCSLTTHLSSLHFHRNNHHNQHKLAAFHSQSHLFSYSPTSPLSPNKPTKTHIFLPRLVAAMVTFSFLLKFLIFLYFWIAQLNLFASFCPFYRKMLRKLTLWLNQMEFNVAWYLIFIWIIDIFLVFIFPILSKQFLGFIG